MKTIRSQQQRAARKPVTLDTSSEKRWEALPGTERELTQARDYVQAIAEAVPPLLVLDADLRVTTANESFCRHFRVTAPQTENRLVYELGNGQWNIPAGCAPPTFLCLRGAFSAAIPSPRNVESAAVSGEGDRLCNRIGMR